MSYLLDPWDRGGAGQPHGVEDRTYSLDCMPQEFPFAGGGDFRSPMLVVRDATGAFGCDLRYERYEVREGKYGLPGLPAVYDGGEEAQTLSVVLADRRLGLEVELLYGVLPSLDVITRAAIVRNVGTSEFTVEKLQTACLDFPAGQFDVISFHGRHCMERVPDRHTVGHGVFAVGDLRGASSHQYNPFIILADPQTTETDGRCWSMSFVWSGGFQAQVERAQYDMVRMQMGLSQDGFSYPLAAGKMLVAPEVIMTYASSGLDRLSNNLHRCIRKHVCRGPWRTPRGRFSSTAGKPSTWISRARTSSALLRRPLTSGLTFWSSTTAGLPPAMTTSGHLGIGGSTSRSWACPLARLPSASTTLA